MVRLRCTVEVNDAYDWVTAAKNMEQCIGETEDLNSKKRISLVSLRAHAKVHTPTTTAVILA